MQNPVGLIAKKAGGSAPNRCKKASRRPVSAQWMVLKDWSRRQPDRFRDPALGEPPVQAAEHGPPEMELVLLGLLRALAGVFDRIVLHIIDSSQSKALFRRGRKSMALPNHPWKGGERSLPITKVGFHGDSSFDNRTGGSQPGKGRTIKRLEEGGMGSIESKTLARGRLRMLAIEG